MRQTLLALQLLASIACSESQTGAKHTSKLIAQNDTIGVTYYVSRFEPLTYPISIIGKIRSANKSNLIFERSGILSTIVVSNGEHVKKGQIIAVIRNTQELLEKENAEIALKKAKVNFENEMLALGDSLYYKERWSQVKENVQLSTGVLAAEINLKQAELAYQQTIIRAPLSGTVEGIRLQPGDLVSTNQPLGSIYDKTNFEITCDILEYDVLKIKRGMTASIYPLASKELELAGVITEINPAVDANGLSRIVIRLRDSKNIIPGLSARVDINVTDEPSIVIPLKAVVKRSERHVVFNLDNGLAKWNYVTLGKDNGKEVQILDGLKENMQIITSNNLQLAHDSPVKIE